MQKPSIFISYSSHDRPCAIRLEQALQQAGYRIWRDESRIDTDWSIEVAHALSNQDLVCLLWSEHAQSSNWVKHEWLTARALERRIAPLFLPNAPNLPRPLANVEGASTDGENFDSLLNLLERIRSFRVKYDYTVLPPRSFLPLLPNPDFVGRNVELADLYLNLIGNLQNLGTRQVALVGMGGCGKTQLAIEFGYRFSYAFDSGVYWIQAANSADWLDSLIELARDRLGLTVSDPAGSQSAKQYLFALQTYCKSHPQLLVIFDNVEDPALLSSGQPLLGCGISLLTLGCGLLFTTRLSLPMPGVAQQVLDVLQPEPAYSLIAAKRLPKNKKDEEEIRKMCEAVGYLPLAIVLAAGYLYNYASVSLHDYLAELTSRALDTVDFEPISQSEIATRHAACVAATLRSQWEALTDETARRVLRLACGFSESAIIPLARLALLCGPLPRRSAIDRPFERACRLLCSVSLMEASADAQSTRIHPLIRQFVGALFSPDQQSNFRSQASAQLETAYSDPACLVAEFERRGIDEILGDIHIAASWAPPAESLIRLGLLLERERGHLASGFLAQLQHRAIGMGEPDRAGRLACVMQQGTAPSIVTMAVNRLEDECWIGTLSAHEWPVVALTAHPDRRRCLSGSQDKKIFLWDIERSQIIRTFSGAAQVTCLSRVWNDRYVLAGYSDASLVVWDIETGEAIRTWTHETPDNWPDVPRLAKFKRPNEVAAVCVDPTASLAVSGVHSFREHLAIWDLATGTKRANLQGHMNGVISLAIDSRGEMLASGSWDHRVLLWDLRTGEQRRELAAHTDGVGALAFSPDGRRLLSGSHDNKIIIWDVQSGAALKTLDGHTGWVNALAFSDDEHLISVGFDSTLKLWNLASGRALVTLHGHSGPIRSLAVLSPADTANPPLTLSGGDDRTIRLWRVTEPRSESTLAASPISAISLEPNSGSLLASASNEFATWSVPGLAKVAATPFSSGEYTTIAVSAISGRALLLATRNRDELLIWDARQGRGIWRMPVAQRAQPVLSDSGTWALAVWKGPNLNDNNAVALNIDSGETKLLSAHRFAIGALALSGNGRRALSVETAACVWDLETGQVLRSFNAPFGTFKAAVDAQGSFAMLGSMESEVTVWDLQTGTLRATLGQRFRFIQKMALNSETNLAIVCGGDPSLNVFRMDTGEKLATLLLSASVSDLCVSRDGIFLTDATGRLWSFRLLMPEACSSPEQR